MATTLYVTVNELNDLQISIMKCIDVWTHEEKLPISQKEILLRMHHVGIKECTAINAINTLLHKGYIRRGYSQSNESIYVQIRRV